MSTVDITIERAQPESSIKVKRESVMISEALTTLCIPRFLSLDHSVPNKFLTSISEDKGVNNFKVTGSPTFYPAA